MQFDLTAPRRHTRLEVFWQQRHDPINPLTMFNVAVNSKIPANFELRVLQHPGQQSGVDPVLHCLGWFHGNPSKRAGFMNHS